MKLLPVGSFKCIASAYVGGSEMEQHNNDSHELMCNKWNRWHWKDLPLFEIGSTAVGAVGVFGYGNVELMFWFANSGNCGGAVGCSEITLFVGIFWYGCIILSWIGYEPITIGSSSAGLLWQHATDPIIY